MFAAVQTLAMKFNTYSLMSSAYTISHYPEAIKLVATISQRRTLKLALKPKIIHILSDIEIYRLLCVFGFSSSHLSNQFFEEKESVCLNKLPSNNFVYRFSNGYRVNTRLTQQTIELVAIITHSNACINIVDWIHPVG